MLKKVIVIAITIFTLVFCVACGGETESSEANEPQNEYGATISNTGGDFDVEIKDISDNGIVIVCKNSDDTDALTATVNYVKILDQTYDPAQADDGGALKMIDTNSDMNVAWIDLDPNSQCEIKIVCDNCTSAEDYKNLEINYDEGIWDSTSSAPTTYHFEGYEIRVVKE